MSVLIRLIGSALARFTKNLFAPLVTGVAHSRSKTLATTRANCAGRWLRRGITRVNYPSAFYLLLESRAMPRASSPCWLVLGAS